MRLVPAPWVHQVGSYLMWRWDCPNGCRYAWWGDGDWTDRSDERMGLEKLKGLEAMVGDHPWHSCLGN